MQVSLRDPMREGADDSELMEIIGNAVCSNLSVPFNFFLNSRYSSLEKLIKRSKLHPLYLDKKIKTSHITLFKCFLLMVVYVLIMIQVKRKKAAHAGMFDLANTANRPMIRIGG